MKTKFVGIILMILLGTPLYVYARGGVSSDFIATLLIGLAVITVIFLVLREFFCWYWKINEIVGILSEIRDFLSNNQINRQPKKKSRKKNSEDTILEELPPAKSETEELWRKKSTEELKGAAEQLSDYTEKTQQIIKKEIQRRGI